LGGFVFEVVMSLRITVSLIGLLLALAAAPALAAQGASPQTNWSVYRYPDLGFSFDAPQAPIRTEKTAPTSEGPGQEITFEVDTGTYGFFVKILDLRRMTDDGFNVDGWVDRIVKAQGEILTASNSVTLDGLTGRDVVYHKQGDPMAQTLRVFYSEHIVYELFTTYPLSSRPAGVDKFQRSFGLMPWHWKLYTMPEVQPAGDLDKIPFSHWVVASTKTFTSIEACRSEALNHSVANMGPQAYEYIRFSSAVCFDPDTKHVRSVEVIPETYKTPPIDVTGVVADPFMR
jgi:hypothetical protein